MEDSIQRFPGTGAFSGGPSRAAFLWPNESKLVDRTLLMLKFESSTSILKLANSRLAAICRAVLLVFCGLLAFPAAAPAQTPDFTLSITGFQPSALLPGSDTTAQITVGAQNGFIGTVSLVCVVTSQESVPTDFCEISPTSVDVPGGALATINATGASAGFYSVYVVGTGPSTTHQTLTQDVTVLSVTPSFTITVQTAVAPSSVPAGNGATGTININPLNGYTSPGGEGVTLSCASITPLVTLPPICSFSPPSPTVPGPNGTVASSTLTITTFGPITTGAVPHWRPLYALWLPLPALALIGLGVGGKKSRTAWTLLSLFILSAALLLVPACTNTSTTTTTPNGITPANTYTFTIAGVDVDHVVSSNSGTGSSVPSVTLTVTAPIQ